MKTILLKITISILLIFITVFSLKSQDIHFSNYNETQLLLNPATAGTQSLANVVINYKNQTTTSSKYRTGGVSADFGIGNQGRKSLFGLGLVAYTDKTGDLSLKTSNYSLMFSTILKLNKHSLLSAGISSGFIQRSIGVGGQWGTQYDGETFNENLSTGESIGAQSKVLFDLGFGLNYCFSNIKKYSGGKFTKLRFGVSVLHPHSPNVSFYDVGTDKLTPKVVGTGWGAFGINGTDFCLEPSFMCTFQGVQKEILTGINVRYIINSESTFSSDKKNSSISFGGTMRLNESIIPTLSYEIDQYSVGISYDFSWAEMAEVNNGKGGFEIFVKFCSAKQAGRRRVKPLIN